jgi:hypothetical protein
VVQVEAKLAIFCWLVSCRYESLGRDEAGEATHPHPTRHKTETSLILARTKSRPSPVLCLRPLVHCVCGGTAMFFMFFFHVSPDWTHLATICPSHQWIKQIGSFSFFPFLYDEPLVMACVTLGQIRFLEASRDAIQNSPRPLERCHTNNNALRFLSLESSHGIAQAYVTETPRGSRAMGFRETWGSKISDNGRLICHGV